MEGWVSSRRCNNVARLAGLSLCVIAALGGCATGGPSATEKAGAGFPVPERTVGRTLAVPLEDERRRDRDGEADRVMDALRIAPGHRVADLRSGTGYYAVRVAGRLGPTGVVYAEETDPALLAELQLRLDRTGLAGARLVPGLPSDPRLPPRSVDVAILSYRYHEIPGPFEFLYRLQASLAPGGRLGIIERDRPAEFRGIPPALLRCELEAVGYRQLELVYLASPESYLAIFEPPATAPDPASIRPCVTRR